MDFFLEQIQLYTLSSPYLQRPNMLIDLLERFIER